MSRAKPIPYARQSTNLIDLWNVASVVKSEWLTTGPRVRAFERDLSRFMDAEVLTVSSGTAALHCAYEAIGLRAGDEIITPPNTFIATQAVAALSGARIVFADVQDDTGNIDPLLVEDLITSRTRAIVAVDYAGHPADLRELKDLAVRYGIYLVEDAAHSLGSHYFDKPVGSFADLTTFSFFATKNIATGEGGAISSLDSELIQKARRYSSHGLIREPASFLLNDQGPWHQEVHQFGLNYRLTDICAALGSSQLSRIEKFKKRRKEIFLRYMSNLNGVEGLTLPTKRSYVDPMWHLFPIRVDSNQRFRIFMDLRNAGIAVQVNYLPAHWHPVFQELGHRRGDYPICEAFYSQEISLPIFHGLKDREIDYISEALIDSISR